MRATAILATLLVLWLPPADAGPALRLAELPVPALAEGAREPWLAPLPDGTLMMSWTEPSDAGFAVRLARFDGAAWGPVRTVTTDPKLYVNWADFASVTALDDGRIAAHWLSESAATPYAYDLKIAFSSDEGRSWSAPVTPHSDGLAVQHGFATLHALPGGRLLAMWLDGRAYDDTGSMQLRSVVVGPDGSVSGEAVADASTCSCCQTSAAASADGVVVAYRDRTEKDIRDIGVVRLEDGAWRAPVIAHADGWEVYGCPVNGPGTAARGDTVALTWFTAPDGERAVKVAFSTDGGRSFDAPVRIDGGDPSGRVDVVMAEDGRALVSWLEWREGAEVLRLCRVAPGIGCLENGAIQIGATGGNFPRMAVAGGVAYLAFTQPLPTSDVAERDMTLRVFRLGE